MYFMTISVLKIIIHRIWFFLKIYIESLEIVIKYKIRYNFSTSDKIFLWEKKNHTLNYENLDSKIKQIVAAKIKCSMILKKKI